MASEQNKITVRRYLDMWNTGNGALADEVLAPDYVDHTHPEVASIDHVKRALQQTRAAMPDFHIAIEQIISEGDMVALRGTIRRTHQGQPLVSHIIWFARIADGQMAELWTGTEASRIADTIN